MPVLQRGGGLRATSAGGARADGLVGSLTGAVRLLEHNAGVRRRAQGGWKPPVAQKGKRPPEHAARAVCSGNAGLAIPGLLGPGVSEKLPQG